jgi:hypothetical protein
MLLVQIPNAYAATKTWVAGSGVWDVAANWSPVGVPGPNDDVHITTAVTVTMSGIDSARSITLGAPATLTCSGCILNVGPGGVISAGTFNIPAGIVGICGTYVNTGTLANSGIFTIGSNILNSGGTVNNTGIMDANILFGLIINSGILTFSGTAGDCVLTVNLHLRTYKIVNVQVQVLQGSTVVAARTVTLSYAAPNAVLTFTGLPLGDLTVKINGYSIRTQTQFTFISDFPSSVSFLTG